MALFGHYAGPTFCAPRCGTVCYAAGILVRRQTPRPQTPPPCPRGGARRRRGCAVRMGTVEINPGGSRKFGCSIVPLRGCRLRGYFLRDILLRRCLRLRDFLLRSCPLRSMLLPSRLLPSRLPFWVCMSVSDPVWVSMSVSNRRGLKPTYRSEADMQTQEGSGIDI